MSDEQKHYHIWTMGCQMNEADSRRLGSQLERLGYAPEALPEKADLVVMNTCVVRQQAENKIYGRLGSLKTAKEKNPEMTIGLMGCFVGVREATRLKKEFPFVDVFMPPSDTSALIEYLYENELYTEELENRQMRDLIQDSDLLLPIEQRGNAVLGYVPIVLGCSHACTFCIIPYRRGRERSRQRTDILTEVRSLADQGVKEVMLIGQIVDRYGQDLDGDYDLADLLRDVNGIDGLERVRFLTSHPNWMTDKLLDTVAELDKLCPHLEVPIQAGNDEVLKNMRRGYTVDDYLKLHDRIKYRLPDAAINTDIIVGFPGETDEQFMDTYNLVKELKFDKVHLAKYSERPRTVAQRRMEDNVSDAEKERRRLMIDELFKEILTETNKKYQDQTLEILIEAKKKDRWQGRTGDNRLVFIEDERDLLGQLLDVKITATRPFSLQGELVDKTVLVNS
ncbi:MAG: tRNA (N6-isopentenyl adenosine(37)-C2)-methylthiotransferase MiaB [Lentisphaeria bacterium]|nr:tRNA (N6-isopentenyl adenosine(37)-C2)-methylthiotransferase MiaB [Lentisphaeria bacterium]NQZ71022.1 tRNA (N6-isopentenyl adenosine(37)-C2)-methylthiotransferase MiaB [Lentisphaeria bacterium]